MVTQRWAALVCGGRDYKDEEAVYRYLKELAPVAVVEGQAHGADELAGQWARDNGVDLVEVPALWAARGKAAGHRRNAFMLQVLLGTSMALDCAPVVLAFPGGKGTASMVRLARAKDVLVVEIVP